MPPASRRAACFGAGIALAIAGPVALIAQAIDVIAGDDGLPAGLTYLGGFLVLVGLAIGGAVVARRTESPRGPAAVAGLAAIAVIEVVGVTRTAIAGEAVRWTTVPVVLALGTVIAVGGAELAQRWPARRGP